LNRIQEDLESALEQIRDVLADLEERAGLVNGGDINGMP
jgi:hypothetical protein